jgi:uncharacterized membrane protein YeiH
MIYTKSKRQSRSPCFDFDLSPANHRPMFTTITQFLDWFGICVFAVSGALVASRKQMDIIGFAVLGTVTGIGGGTVRDILMGALPVFWVQKPAYLLTCIGVSCLMFFVAHLVFAQRHIMLWCDAIGLAVFSVTGAQMALNQGVGAVPAVAMGLASATFGGVIRDLLGGEIPFILHREIYVSASLLGATVLVACEYLGLFQNAAIILGFAAAFTLRGLAIMFDLSLPVFSRVLDDE